jgi:hypothetical protein
VQILAAYPKDRLAAARARLGRAFDGAKQRERFAYEHAESGGRHRVRTLESKSC